MSSTKLAERYKFTPARTIKKYISSKNACICALHFKMQLSDGLHTPDQAFWLPTAKDMWNEIQNSHTAPWGVVRREYLAARRGSRPSSGIQEASTQKPYLPSGLREPHAHFLAKRRWMWVHKFGFKRWQHSAYINETAWSLWSLKTWLCFPPQPEHLLLPQNIIVTVCSPVGWGHSPSIHRNYLHVGQKAIFSDHSQALIIEKKALEARWWSPPVLSNVVSPRKCRATSLCWSLPVWDVPDSVGAGDDGIPPPATSRADRKADVSWYKCFVSSRSTSLHQMI